MFLALVVAAVMNGYADDAACADCHADRAKTYQHVGNIDLKKFCEIVTT